VALCLFVRVRLLQTPLERDEGEYAYAGQLMLQGIPPYALARNMKLPGTYAAYAVIMRAFGQTAGAIHLGLLLTNAAAVALLFLLGRRLFGARAGLASCAAYSVMSLGAGVAGTQAHATHFVVLPAIGGLLLLLRAVQTDRAAPLALSGVLFGLAFVAKQHGAFFGLFALLWIAWTYRRRALPKLALFGACAALPFAVTCLALWRAGVFRPFWFWTFDYSRAYISESSALVPMDDFWRPLRPILLENAGLWLLVLVGLGLAWRATESRLAAAFLTGLLLFSFAATTPGGFFRDHYFVMTLPAAALLAGAAAGGRRNAAAWLFAAALIFSFWRQHDWMFRLQPQQVSRMLYDTNPFPEAARIADYIRGRTAPGELIAILGSEPEICFYAHRHSATPYIYMYPLTEDQPYAPWMQSEMIRDIESQQPRYLVFVHVESSWLTDLNEPHPVLDWWNRYRDEHYELAGAADILPEDRTEYRWDEAARGYQFQSDDYVQVFQRR